MRTERSEVCYHMIKSTKYDYNNYVFQSTSGQYQYIDPFGKDIQVQYWVDGLGFHQTDNRPSYELSPVTDTPEVKAAKEEHERLWKEAAKLNGIDAEYNSHAEKLESENDGDYADLDGQVSNQHQSLARYPVLPYAQHIVPGNAKSFGKVVDDAVILDSISKNEASRSRFARQQTDEVPSEPRGFFYNFDYQVPFIAERNSALRQVPETQASENIESIIDIRVDDRHEEESLPRAKISELHTIASLEGSNLSQEYAKTANIQSKREASSDLKTEENKRQTADAKTSPTKRGRGSIKFNSQKTY